MDSTSSSFREQTPVGPSSLDANKYLPNDGICSIDEKHWSPDGRGTCASSSLKFTSRFLPIIKKMERQRKLDTHLERKHVFLQKKEKKEKEYHAFSRIRFSIKDIHDILSIFWGKLDYLFDTWHTNSDWLLLLPINSRINHRFRLLSKYLRR